MLNQKRFFFLKRVDERREASYIVRGDYLVFF